MRECVIRDGAHSHVSCWLSVVVRTHLVIVCVRKNEERTNQYYFASEVTVHVSFGLIDGLNDEAASGFSVIVDVASIYDEERRCETRP